MQAGLLGQTCGNSRRTRHHGHGRLCEYNDGVDLVVHCASPFSFQIQDIQRDLIAPAVKGTAEILDTIKATPTVRRLVLTSSFAAVVDPFKGPRADYSYRDEELALGALLTSKANMGNSARP